MKETKRKQIEELIDKAAQSKNALDALQFSQAACNSANAIAALVDTERKEANN